MDRVFFEAVVSLVGFVDHAHASTTKVLEDLIVGDRLTDEENHYSPSSIGRDGCLNQASQGGRRSGLYNGGTRTGSKSAAR